MSDPVEYRVVCAHFGQLDHRTHHWPKRTLEKAEQSVIDLEHKATVNVDLSRVVTAKRWYAAEVPYRVQVRTVTPWEDWLDG